MLKFNKKHKKYPYEWNLEYFIEIFLWKYIYFN